MAPNQKLRNALSAIEDEARSLRNARYENESDLTAALNLITQLTQLIREEIVQ